MSDIDNLGLYFEGEPMDTIGSNNNICKYVLKEEADFLVSVIQSNSDLLNESQGI